MKEKAALLASSLSTLASLCPAEDMAKGRRYVVLADLKMGDGGSKDELAPAKKALYDLLGGWYLQQGYTLVLNGDVEDLRSFWLKDVMAAWPKLYAVFDAFADSGRLRKIVGERDLSLLRISSYPYALSHSLRLHADDRSILITHGHQAEAPFYGRDYLADYLLHWLASSGGRRSKRGVDTGEPRAKVERRLQRAAGRGGYLLIQGHTRRPLFESISNREAVRAEAERLLGREGPQKSISPCLFSPGKALGSRGIRAIEIEDGRIALVRWTKGGRRGARDRVELRSAPISDIFERMDLPTEG